MIVDSQHVERSRYLRALDEAEDDGAVVADELIGGLKLDGRACQVADFLVTTPEVGRLGTWENIPVEMRAGLPR